VEPPPRPERFARSQRHPNIPRFCRPPYRLPGDDLFVPLCPGPRSPNSAPPPTNSVRPPFLARPSPGVKGWIARALVASGPCSTALGLLLLIPIHRPASVPPPANHPTRTGAPECCRPVRAHSASGQRGRSCLGPLSSPPGGWCGGGPFRPPDNGRWAQLQQVFIEQLRNALNAPPGRSPEPHRQPRHATITSLMTTRSEPGSPPACPVPDPISSVAALDAGGPGGLAVLPGAMAGPCATAGLVPDRRRDHPEWRRAGIRALGRRPCWARNTSQDGQRPAALHRRPQAAAAQNAQGISSGNSIHHPQADMRTTSSCAFQRVRLPAARFSHRPRPVMGAAHHRCWASAVGLGPSCA